MSKKDYKRLFGADYKHSKIFNFRCVLAPLISSQIVFTEQDLKRVDVMKPAIDWRETFAKWGYVPCVQ